MEVRPQGPLLTCVECFKSDRTNCLRSSFKPHDLKVKIHTSHISFVNIRVG